MFIFALFTRALLHFWPLALAAATQVAQGTPRAYVPNENGGTISVIDTNTDLVLATWPVGGKPRGVAATPDGRFLWISDRAGAALRIVETRRGEILRTLGLGDAPEGIALSRDGRWLAAAVELAHEVVLVDAHALRIVARIAIPGGKLDHAVFSPDGRWLYVSVEEAAQVAVIDVAAQRHVAGIAVGPRPRGIGFTPDGRRAYVACERDGAVYAIDVAAQRAVARTPVGEFPSGVTVQRDGKAVWVASGRQAMVSLLEVGSMVSATVPADGPLPAERVIAGVRVGERPWDMALTTDGAKLYVANGRSGSVTVIDVRTRRPLREIGVGPQPWGVAIPETLPAEH